MPLIWNAEKVSGLKKLRQDAMEWSKTEYLCFELMRVGVATITESNIEDVWSRVDVAQKVWGAILSKSVDGVTSPAPYTKSDIVRRIGYACNASTRTRQQFALSLLK
jgi:hypothetical protein